MRETITRTKGSKERTLPKGSMDPPTEMTLFSAKSPFRSINITYYRNYSKTK